jgi:hypothetical protein
MDLAGKLVGSVGEKRKARRTRKTKANQDDTETSQ